MAAMTTDEALRPADAAVDAELEAENSEVRR